MGLREEIDKIEINYWDFSKVTTSGVHKISAYPATMVPDMQNQLIKLVIAEDQSIQNILDPFHGSGVTLVEGTKYNLDPVGIDINPLANLITKVKLQGVNKLKIKSANNNIKKYLYDSSFHFKEHNFQNIEKWYRKDIIYSFSRIKCAIEKEKVQNIRQYYWVCLINLLKKYSNSRSSTFKLHIKTPQMIDSMRNNINKEFIERIDNFYKFLPDYSRHRKLNLLIDKSEIGLNTLSDNSIDLIVTSPPYGDNSTTVTYGQYSILPIFWINRKDLGRFDEQLIQNFSSIDSHSLGGCKNAGDKNHDSQVLADYLLKIDSSKKRKVINFISDYLKVMDQLSRVLKPNKYILLTLGNRRVDNQVVPLSDITIEYFRKKGFRLEKSIMRNIPSKRMPRRVSRVKEESVESMNKEVVLIFQKKQGRSDGT